MGRRGRGSLRDAATLAPVGEGEIRVLLCDDHALVRESLLPKHATKWGERLARTALLLRHCEEEEPWQEFFISAKEVLAGRSLAEVPLMTRVAENTVEAYGASRSTGHLKRQRRPPFFVH